MTDNLQLIPAALKDYSIFQNLGRFYVYDMSAYMEGDAWKMPETGLYECIDLRKYFDDAHAFPFLVRVNGEIAGFAIVDNKTSDSSRDFCIAQFFITKRFQKKGLGRQAAFQCFDRFQGNWEIRVMPDNRGAYLFWKSVIAHYTNSHYEEFFRKIPLFGNELRCVFWF